MSTPSGIDLSSAADVSAREDEGIAIHIRDANGEPAYVGEKPVTVRIAGTYSKLYRRTVDVQRERMLKRRTATLTGEALTANQIELVAACILGWEGFTNAGQPFPFTRENATVLLTRAPWIREQLEEAQIDHAGFSRPASAT